MARGGSNPHPRFRRLSRRLKTFTLRPPENTQTYLLLLWQNIWTAADVGVQCVSTPLPYLRVIPRSIGNKNAGRRPRVDAVDAVALRPPPVSCSVYSPQPPRRVACGKRRVPPGPFGVVGPAAPRPPASETKTSPLASSESRPRPRSRGPTAAGSAARPLGHQPRNRRRAPSRRLLAPTDVGRPRGEAQAARHPR